MSRVFQVGDQPVRALDAVSLTLEAGEYVSVMGPSGSGKSTLLNILGLLDRPDSGEYILMGTATRDLSEEALAKLRHDHIGFVFQAYHLIGRLSAVENVALPLMLSGIPLRERTRHASELLAELGMGDRLHHRPAQLSGGQRQRVAIARALISDPAVLLADEPTGNLDSHASQEVMQVLERFNSSGITLIVVTHDPEVGARARRHLRMVDGHIHRDSRDDSLA